MFYTVNHTMHSAHRVAPGSATEAKIACVFVGKRLVMKIGSAKHSVFDSPQKASAFQVLLEHCGAQS